jgi:succinate dehydrogenase/fumarate reductase flavoprotein subunit
VKTLGQLQEVINTDVLVLGGGIAGCFAAIKAKESGVEVVVVDKANIGRSGDSHQMSGVLTYFIPKKDDHEKWYRECVEASQWLSDQKRLEGMIEESTDRITDLYRWGVKFQKEGDEFIRKPGVGHYYARNALMTHGGFQLMSVLRGEVLRRGVRSIERVMVTDLLTSDGEVPTGGRITGAVGFNIKNGKVYWFKSKATIIATGSTRLILPRMNMPSLSGDGVAMAVRAGCEMRNMDISFYNHGPRDFNTAPGANPLFMEGAILVNARGERFMERWDPIRMERAPRVIVTNAMAVETREGRGPVYLDATHLDRAAHSRLEMAIPILIRSFATGGLSLRKDRIPYVVYLESLGPGGIRVDRENATTIPGLYAAGAASDHGEDGVTNIISHGMESAIGGHRAGEAAAKYSLETGEPVIHEQKVKAMIEEIFMPLVRKPRLMYQEVLEHSVSLFEKGLLGPVRNERGLRKAIDTVKEIKEQEVPRLQARDFHDLTKIIGLQNALFFPELLAKCALLRTESRGSHYREDYPEANDRNWLKWVIAKRGEDGIKIWAEPIPFNEYPLRPEGGEN